MPGPRKYPVRETRLFDLRLDPKLCNMLHLQIQTGATGTRYPGTLAGSSNIVEATLQIPARFKTRIAVGHTGSRCCSSYYQDCSCYDWRSEGSMDCCSRNHRAAHHPVPHCLFYSSFFAFQPPRSFPISSSVFEMYSYCFMLINLRSKLSRTSSRN